MLLDGNCVTNAKLFIYYHFHLLLFPIFFYLHSFLHSTLLFVHIHTFIVSLFFFFFFFFRFILATCDGKLCACVLLTCLYVSSISLLRIISLSLPACVAYYYYFKCASQLIVLARKIIEKKNNKK